MLALKKIIPLICLLIFELEAQFLDSGSGFGTQVGFDGSTFSNLNSQSKQLASKGAFLSNQGSQANLQQGFGSNADLFSGLNFPSVGGSGQIFNKQSQIGTQFGGRKKREAGFTNIGSGVGTQIGLERSTFLNQNSQIDQAHASAGASITGFGSQYRHQQGYTNDQQLLTLLGRRKKREAQFLNIGSGVGTQKESSFGNLNSQVRSQFGELGSDFQNRGSQIGSQQGLGSLGLGSIAQLPSFSAGGSGHIFNKQSQINTQIGG